VFPRLARNAESECRSGRTALDSAHSFSVCRKKQRDTVSGAALCDLATV
jgi:hypothetical protein